MLTLHLAATDVAPQHEIEAMPMNDDFIRYTLHSFILNKRGCYIKVLQTQLEAQRVNRARCKGQHNGTPG